MDIEKGKTMKKIIIIFFICSSSILFAQTQTIVQAEYFTDINTQPGKGTQLNLPDFGQNAIEIPWDSLPPVKPGTIYYVRIKSSGFTDINSKQVNGKWSFPITIFYSPNGRIVQGEANLIKKGGSTSKKNFTVVDGKLDQPIEFFNIDTRCEEIQVGDTIQFRIKSNLGFWSDWLNIEITDTYMKPPPPANLSLKMNNDVQTNIELNWESNSNGAIRYVIERKVNNNSFLKYDSISAPVTTYKDFQIESGKKYSYRVNAISYHTCLNSDFSNTAEITVVGVNDDYLPTNNPIILSPNPATNQIICTVNNFKTVNKIEIYNMIGIKVLDIKSSEQSTKINISNLSDGLYFLRVGNQTKMFMKE